MIPIISLFTECKVSPGLGGNPVETAHCLCSLLTIVVLVIAIEVTEEHTRIPILAKEDDRVREGLEHIVDWASEGLTFFRVVVFYQCYGFDGSIGDDGAIEEFT